MGNREEEISVFPLPMFSDPYLDVQVLRAVLGHVDLDLQPVLLVLDPRLRQPLAGLADAAAPADLQPPGVLHSLGPLVGDRGCLPRGRDSQHSVNAQLRRDPLRVDARWKSESLFKLLGDVGLASRGLVLLPG